MGAPDLESRIAAAFTPDAKSSDFPGLIADTETAAKAATTKAAAAKEKALDPTCPPVEVATARREMEDAAFVSERMSAAATRLRDRYRQVTATEENQRRQLAYDHVTSERDKLAEELKQKYPELVAMLVELMSRIDANNNEIASINAKLPDAAERILEAELVARGLRGFVENWVQAVSIVQDMRLPAWDHDVHHPYAWPLSDRMRPNSIIPISIRA